MDRFTALIRRQSVIIEGLTLETDELKRRCQMLEDELATPGVDELQQKLDKVEGKLEETENYCYQVVEENVELKNEIETLESEISEVQDTFRDKDAKEFKKTKWELENLAKTCRNTAVNDISRQFPQYSERVPSPNIVKTAAKFR